MQIKFKFVYNIFLVVALVESLSALKYASLDIEWNSLACKFFIALFTVYLVQLSN